MLDIFPENIMIIKQESSATNIPVSPEQSYDII